MNILAIDIGGTKSALGLCSLHDARITNVSGVIELASRDFSSLESMIDHWQLLNPTLKFTAVGAGVAGPVKNFKCHLTNLGWNIDGEKISLKLKKPFKLCNDMASHGWGILGLNAHELTVLNEGQKNSGAMALIAAGTGLGESVIGWNGMKHSPMPGEGGHSSFSPGNDFEDALLFHLRQELGGHVSWERVLGGYDGFRNLAKFYAKHSKQALPEYLGNNLELQNDWGRPIISKAHEGDQFAVKILEIYARLYGKEAANLALKCVPSSGLYIGGGIAPRILPWLSQFFMEGFLDKGRFQSLLKSFPVYVINDPLNGLKGAALQFLGDFQS